MENRKQADSQEEQLALKEERRYENAGEEDAPVFCKVVSGLPQISSHVLRAMALSSLGKRRSWQKVAQGLQRMVMETMLFETLLLGLMFVLTEFKAPP